MNNKSKLNCAFGFGALVANIPFAWAFMFGIGMSSQPHRDANTFYLFGVASDLLPIVLICTVPASVISFASFYGANKKQLAWFVSVPYFLLLSTYVILAFQQIS